MGRTAIAEQRQPGPEITARVANVTPVMAEAWLRDRARNRAISTGTVDSYAEDMARGNWRINNNGIGFDVNGKLIDGQHRLAAVCKSECTVPFVLVEGIPETAIECIDIGRARSVTSVLEITHGTERATFKVAIVKQLERMIKRSTRRLSPPQIMERLIPLEASMAWAIGAMPRGSVAYPACVAAALIHAYSTSPAKVDAFTQKLVTGEALAATDPAYMLREYLMSTRGATGVDASRRDTFLKTLYCVRAAIQGTTIKRVYANEDTLASFMPVDGAQG